MTSSDTQKYLVATDVGGTCTDTVVFAEGESIVLGKSLSTPPNFADGVLESLGSAATSMGLTVEELLSQTSLFIHGSTVVDNSIFTRDGGTVGLITTEGFEDTIFVTRGGYGRWGGLTEERMKNMVHTDRAVPLVSHDRVIGVPERVDYKGSVLQPLSDESIQDALAYLLDKEVDAVAVSLLWSFYNPDHERRIRQFLVEISPDTFCTLSSDVAPTPGEYERTSTTVINAYSGQLAKKYLTGLEEMLSASGYHGPIMVMQGYGGLLPAIEAKDRAIGMLECGPAAGVIGSRALGQTLNHGNIIATDMGGTTFKVSVIQDGEIEYAREPMVDRFHYSQPKIEVVSIGAGGGSVVWLEEGSLAPRVGPHSAGSRPGPVCYGLGGEEPTLTDVFLLIGYMDPDSFLGGSIKLDVDHAREVFREKIADPLGLTVEEAAWGVYRVATAQITDLIREITVERGLDPRDFVLHAFGGSCGMVFAMFGEELGVKQMVVPYTASVNCAFGLVSADIVHEFSSVALLPIPSPIDSVNDVFSPMLTRAQQVLADEGFSQETARFDLAIDFRYSRQVHEVTTPVRALFPLSEEELAKAVNDFEQIYEQKYGKGSAFREAGIEMTQFRVSAKGLMSRPELQPIRRGSSDASPALKERRPIFVDALSGMVEADIYDFELLKPGNVFSGPAVVHTPITTIVLQMDQEAEVDEFRNVVVSNAREA